MLTFGDCIILDDRVVDRRWYNSSRANTLYLSSAGVEAVAVEQRPGCTGTALGGDLRIGRDSLQDEIGYNLTDWRHCDAVIECSMANDNVGRKMSR